MACSNALESVREDDYVEYFIFPVKNGNETEEVLLKNCLENVNNIISKLTKDYIWHKDEFNLCVRPSNSNLLDEDSDTKENLPSHLYGSVHYGDNIEDEWFIVYLLLKLSQEVNDLIVRVVDSDGEFLLIEAAEQLPNWADPESCEKRVYIYQGKVHLIPSNQLKNPENVTVSTCLDIIRNKSLITEASTHIQNEIFKRINEYPDKIKQNLHRAKVYLPVGVAVILKHKPNLIAPAIISFCNRDPIDMKACRAMKYFPPENRVYCNITFTKCLYAMLCHSKYIPDRKIGWNLPAPSSPQYKSHILGIKIACGFEILASQAKPSEDLDNDKNWHSYLKSLNEKNYFRGLLEQSQEYNNLLNNAKDYFKSHKDSLHYNPVLGQEILELNKKLEYNIDDLKKAEETIPADDDDSWLNVNPEELDKMLEERYGRKIKNKQNDTENIAGKLSEFLDHVSGIEGVEFPAQDSKLNENLESPIRPQRGIKKKDKSKVQFSSNTNPENSTNSNENSKINFDASTFSCAVQNILDLVIPEDSWDLESGSEMSEYEDESDMDLDKVDSGKVNKKIKEYMEAMDRELAATNIGKSFEKKNDLDLFEDIESFKPVDIDMTALKNMLESYQSQMGGPGPATNMLGPMGIHLESTSSQNKDV